MANYPLKNISIGGDNYQIPIPPIYVIKCSDSVAETSWTDWQAGGRTLATPSLFKDGEPASWSELTPESNVSFELTSDGGTNFKTFKLSEVNSNPDYGSSMYQFEYIGSESGSLPNSFAYIVRIGFFNGNMNTKKGYRIPVAAQGGGGGGSTLKELTVQDDYGQPIRVSDFLNGGSGMVLYDNDRAAGITDDQLLSDFNSGEVLIHVGPSYEMEKMHFKLDGYSISQANRVYGWVYDNGKKLALFEYSGNKKWILQIIN